MFQGLFSSEAEFATNLTTMTHGGVAAAVLLRDALRDPTTRSRQRFHTSWIRRG